jgi:hypothetical chaperone protein
MPTALFFSSEDGHIAYGTAALQDYLTGVQERLVGGRLMRAIKSLLGSPLMNEQTLVNGQLLSYFDIVVLFFKEIKHRAEADLGFGISAARLGRPVHFVDDNPERDTLAQLTLERAAKAAGFDNVSFELEPIAAAFDYEQRMTQNARVLVADIGGGTSDFTVIQIGPGHKKKAQRSADILATTGIHLGGTDFDRLLDLGCVMPLLGYGHRGPSGRELPNRLFFELSTWHLVHHATTQKSLAQARDLWRDYTDLHMHQRLMHVLDERLGHQLLACVESAKISCSVTGQPAHIDLACMPNMNASLTPDNMQTLLQKQLAAIVQCAQDCVTQAGLAAPDVVYLTGGSSALTPLVDALQQAFPSANTVHGDRFGGVAAGLAMAGAACD